MDTIKRYTIIGVLTSTRRFMIKKWMLLNFALLFSILSHSASAQFDYRVYKGTFDLLPDFSTLTPIATGQSSTIDVSVTPENQSVALVFTQQITVNVAGTYEFSTRSDDGSKLYINDSVVVNNDGLHAPRTVVDSAFLPVGIHDLRVEFFEKSGGEVLEVAYRTGSEAFKPIPANGILGDATPSQFSYAVYDGSFNVLPDFSTLTPIATGQSPTIDLSVTNQVDTFGLVFTHQITVTEEGEYIFSATSDDGSRILIDDTVVVDNDGLHGAVTVNNSILLVPGVYSLRVEFFEQGGGEVLNVAYRTGNAVFEPIPSDGVLAYTAVDRAAVGRWSSAIQWPHIAISAANLPDGRIITWSSTETNAFPSNREFTHSSIFDPQNNTFENTDSNFHDMFCAGITLIEDGSIIASGGNPFDSRTSTFSLATMNWSPLSDMNDTRWYGTNVTLPNNKIFSSFAKSAGNRSEVYDPENDTWTASPNANMQTLVDEQNTINAAPNPTGALNLEWWSHLAVTPQGDIFQGGPTPTWHRFDPVNNTPNEVLGQPIGDTVRMYGNAVTYDEGKVMLIGGGDRRSNTPTSINNVYLVDLNAAAPVVTPGAPMNFPRALSNSVTLPNGEVLVVGGNTGAKIFSDAGSVFPAEIYTPSTDSWRVVDSISVPRNYHSTALLMKDGRVLSAGGGGCGGCAVNHLDGQIFSPPYLFDSNGDSAIRPTLSNVAAQVSAGNQITVTASSDTTAFSIVRLSGTTHHLNTDQRFLPMDSVNNGDGTFTLTFPANPNVLIVGNYWLFAVNGNGTPSIGETVQVVRQVAQAVDTDGDGVTDDLDAFPNDPTETVDSDGDGVGDNGDAFPSNASETVDTDGDGVGDNADAFPNDPTRTEVDIDNSRSGILREWWFGINGNKVSTLTNLAAYPNSPDGSETLNIFEGPVNWNNNYGSRISGVLYAPVTGEYTFWISGDDFSELWLSSNGASANRALIAEVPGWTSSRQWNKFPQQRSSSIQLQAGQAYYIEALHKEGRGGDNIAVAWQRPDGTTLEILNEQYFIPPVDPTTDSDGDGVPDNSDAFPNDSSETTDSDGDGVGNNADAFPNDATETNDSDGDGVGDNSDAFPNDSTRSEFSAITALPSFPRNSSTLIVESSTGSDRIWNVNPDNNSVAVSDSDGNLLEQIVVGKTPWSLAKSTSTDQVYVTNKGASTLSIINTQTLSVEQTISLPENAQPHGIVFDDNGVNYYVVLEATAEIEKRLVSDHSLVSRLALSGTPRHISMSFDDSRLYVSNFITPLVSGESTIAVDVASGRAEVFSIDVGTFSLTNTIALTHDDRPISESQGPGMPNYLSAPIVSFDNRYAYIPSKKDNIDAGTLRGKFGITFDSTVRANTSRIALFSETEDSAFRVDHDNSSVATHAALTGDNRYLLVTLETSRELAVYDTQNGFQLMRLPTGRAPQSVALSSDGSQAYVHNFMDRSISRFDLTQMLRTDLPATNELPSVSVVSNEQLADNVLLGKQHFYDAADDRLAFDNYLSCASCHKEAKHDGRVWDFGRFGEGLRNTTSLLGKGGLGQGLLHWSGNFDEVQDFEAQIRGLAGGTGLMSDVDFTSGTVSEPLGEIKTGLSADLDALAAYLDSLDQPVLSPLRSDAGLSVEAQQGQQLFVDKGCVTCHAGTEFTDSVNEVRHDIGTLSLASGQRLAQVLDGFDTPSLLGLWTSAPYLHDGSAATVEQAIVAHSNLIISNDEASSLARFLHELPEFETPNNNELLEIEAEDAQLFGSFVQVNDSLASNGAYIEAPEGSGNFYGSNNTDRAEFIFRVATAGTYRIEGTVRALNGTSNSFWVKVDDAPSGNGYLWDTNTSASFAVGNVTTRGTAGPVTVFLSEGEHSVSVSLREDGTQLDKLRLVKILEVTSTETLQIEAEDARLFGDFISVVDSAANEGTYVHTPEGVGNFYGGNTSDGIEFRFQVATAGTYNIEAAVRALSGTSDSFWVKVDGLPSGNGYLWDVGIRNSFLPVLVTNRGTAGAVNVFLSEGEHTVTFYLREDGTQLDSVRLVLQN